MLRSLNELQNYAIGATDGEVGHVKDFYFDDKSWVVRYLVVETGSWLSSRKVLISPYAVRDADWDKKILPVHLTKYQVEHCPDIDTERPVSRQHEMMYADYYGYPYYWAGSGMWGDGLYLPQMMPADYPGVGSVGGLGIGSGLTSADKRAEAKRYEHDDPHLRSCKSVTGYHIKASDGELGHVSAMLIDEESWAIPYLVVDTSNWWMGQQVLIPPEWATHISWSESMVTVDLPRQTIRDAPRFESSAELNRQQEQDFYHYYTRPNYWEREHQRDLLVTHN